LYNKSRPQPVSSKGTGGRNFAGPAALDGASKQLEGHSGNGNDPTTKKGKKEDAATKATWPGGKKFGLTALEEFARTEAKEIPALAEAIARRDEMQRAVDRGKNVSSRALNQALLEERQPRQRQQAQHQAKPGV
jgi:hypothetical protein